MEDDIEDFARFHAAKVLVEHLVHEFAVRELSCPLLTHDGGDHTCRTTAPRPGRRRHPLLDSTLCDARRLPEDTKHQRAAPRPQTPRCAERQTPPGACRLQGPGVRLSV